MKRRSNGRRGHIQLCIKSIAFVVAVCLIAVCAWITETFNIDFAEVLYTFTSPMDGISGGSIVSSCLSSCVPAFGVIAIYIALGVGICRIQRTFSVSLKVEVRQHRLRVNALKLTRHIMTAVSICAVLFSVPYVDQSLRISDYFAARKNPTTIYEDYYIDPNSVGIEADGNAKNLIYIYLESMETTYASQDVGGWQPEPYNYIPNLTALAQENCSFSNSGQLGGFYSVKGTNWTMGALFATTSGLPYAFPVGGNYMDKYQNFASGVTALGDILEEKGYQNEFLCGSDGNFAGRKKYFEQHGNYEVFDYYTAIEKGYIPDDYYVWLGYEDAILYEIAKDELLRLAQSGSPFNFTMLTVDTHFVEGYVCDLCRDEYNFTTANVVACADWQVAEFVQWCQEQDFYQDTVIVITGDHPRMDNYLVDGVEYYDRTVYNCILNCDLQGKTENREFAAMDMFPTVLAAMGFQVEGDRLGLGVNLFSNEETLCEMLGLEVLNSEVLKYSAYYLEHFTQ